MSNVRVHFVDESSFLAHHGVKGQKWGIRRYQNEDGTLTEEGKKKYGDLDGLSGKEISDAIKNRKYEGKAKAATIISSTISGASLGYTTGGLLKEYGETSIGKIPIEAVSIGIGAIEGLLAGLASNKLGKAIYEKRQAKKLNKGAY